MLDDLNRPLGLEAEASGRFGRQIAWGPVAFAGLGLIAVSLVVFVAVTGDRNSGEPYAIARIEHEAPPAPPAAAPAPPAAQTAISQETTATVPQTENKSGAAELERSSGVKVIRPTGTNSPDPLIIRVPEAASVSLKPAPDPRLVEKSRYGMLPRIGSDGVRPAEVYARPVIASPKLNAGVPRIAIFIGGMGLSRATTQEAIDKLPGAVTLAFAPYGGDLEAQVARARAAGHEILLQVPMDTFSGDADPGPHTLHSDRAPDAIVDDLHWLMTRFAGFIGVTNFLGGRFTAQEGALAPVIRETKDRGLLYIDDATSPRSVADAVAARADLPFARADIVLDAETAPQAIDAALARLEAAARKNGTAIGWATAMPSSIERVARFARGLEDKGIALVPVSSAVSVKSRPSVDARAR